MKFGENPTAIPGAIEANKQIEVLEPLGELLSAIEQQKLAASLARMSGRDEPTVMNRLRFASIDYSLWARDEYLQSHDSLKLVGQDNIRRYRAVEHQRVRVLANDKADDIILAIMAAVSVGCRPVVSYDGSVQEELIDMLETLTFSWAGKIEFVEESDQELAQQILGGWVDRVRYPSGGKPSLTILEAGREAFIPTLRANALPFGRIEPLWFVTEQSLSVDYHRYGNLARRATEQRSKVQ
jgi:RHH-type proline utilization regulon transcriptional repressor/proline dehydrogenase/delta 1-pyrroline-5-carboxylate dehydrogenase